MSAVIQCVMDIGTARSIFASIGAAPVEIGAFAFLDHAHRVVALHQTPIGSPTAIDVPLGAVARQAIIIGAAGIVMAHNHPSSDPDPSDADIVVTREAARLLGLLGVRLIDHLIVTRADVRSLRAMGLL